MAASIVFQILTAGVAFTTAAFQIQSQRRIKTLESQASIESQQPEPTSHSESAPIHADKKNDDPPPQSPDAPPMASKARRELYEKLAQGRMQMYFGYDHGIKQTCEERCDELEGPCGIYEELQRLHEKCKSESKEL